MNLFCRITCSYVTLTPVVQLLETKCDKLVIYEHNANTDNIHIHMYIENCTVSTDTIKNYCKRFGINGGLRGSGWSFKSAHDTGCIVYMSKGNLEPSFIKGFTQEEIVSYRDSWVERTRETSNSKYQTKLQYIVRESPSQAKKRKNDLVQEIIVELGDHKPVNLEYYVDEKVVRVIIKILNDNNVVFGRYTIRDYYDTVCARKFTDSFVDSMIKFMTPKN